MSNYRPITDFWLLGRAKRANGIIHYLWPQPVKGLAQKEVAAVCVTTGRNARARHFVVFEKELAA